MSETATRPARVYPKVDFSAVPTLPEWISLPDAAIQLGMSRARLHQMAGAEQIKTLHKLSEGSRSPLLMSRSELAEMLKHKDEEPAA